MLRLLAPLFGFAVFGALFAGIYYDEPDEIWKEMGDPKFRLGPLEAKPDFIEPYAAGENVTVNITIVRGGPIDVYVLDMENLTLHLLNGTRYGFQFPDNASFYDPLFSKENVTDTFNFTFIADGENRWAVMFVSRIPYPEDWANLTAEEREPYITEIAVNMRYLEIEQRSLVIGTILAIPSVFLIVFTLWVKSRRQGREGTDEARPYHYPRDKGL